MGRLSHDNKALTCKIFANCVFLRKLIKHLWQQSEKEGVKIVNITINVPDQVGEAINQLPNRDSVDLYELKKIIENYEQSLSKTTTPNKWQHLADRVRKNPPLSGAGDQVLQDSKEFRENFAFSND